jgi:hypothetical protein
MLRILCVDPAFDVLMAEKEWKSKLIEEGLRVDKFKLSCYKNKEGTLRIYYCT